MLVTDLTDLAILTGAVREIDPPVDYTLNGLLPDDTIADVEYSTRKSTVTRGEAEFRAYDAETPIGRRRATVTTGRQLLPPLGTKFLIGEFERIMLQRAQGMNTQALENGIYDDARSGVVGIRRRMERARAQVLYTGKFSLVDENDLTLEADFQVDPDNLDVEPATPLSDPDLDLYGFFEALIEQYRDSNIGGQAPGRFTTSRRAVNAMRANKQVIRSIFGPLATEGNVTVAQLSQALVDNDFPTLAQYNTRVDGEYLIPTDRLIITPTDPRDLGRTVWGITAESLELVGSNAVDMTLADAPGIVAVTLKEGDPVRIWTKSAAVGMPAIDDPTLLMTAKLFG